MNKQTKLTWKYFYQQKVYEIKKQIKKQMLGIFISSFLISLMGMPMGLAMTEDFHTSFIWITYVSIGIFSLWLIVGIFLLVRCFFRWLSNNWKKAKRRAIKDLKK